MGDRGTQIPDPMFPSVQIPGYSSANSRFRPSEFPRRLSQRSEVGPKFQIPCFQVCRFQDTPLQIPDSDLPSFQGASPRGPRWDPNSRSHVSKCADSRILLCKFQIPCFRVSGPSASRGSEPEGAPKIPDSEFPSLQFPGTLHGSEAEGPQIPDSEFPSFRGPLAGPSRRDTKFQIPSFRVSGGPLQLPRAHLTYTLHV